MHDRQELNRRGFTTRLGLTGCLLGLSPHASSYARHSPEKSADITNGAQGSKAAVATVHPSATDAAIACLKRGGNAVDAAVAASLMLSVVDSHNSGIGGGGLALIRLANGSMVAIDGREMAPKNCSAEQYKGNDGKPDPKLSQDGPLAVATPGLIALLEKISTSFGKVSWKESLLGAAEVADQGFRVSAYFASVLKDNAAKLRKFPSSASVLFDPSGQPWSEGSTLRQPDLARSLRSMAEQGSKWFYEGEFAERMEKFMLQEGGYLRASDFADYKALSRSVIQCKYRGQTVNGFSPPSSGGIHIAQMLTMLEQFDVAEIFKTRPEQAYHLLLEVMKRALADRAHWLGDADFAKVPKALLDPQYLKYRASTIDLNRATKVESHGVPPRADIDLFGAGGHTTHLTVADADGNVVALTQTVNTSFGSKMILPGTGIVLNNEMDDFSLAPGVRNAFGLLGSDANGIVPRKRPLSSMSPSIVTDGSGNPTFTCGAAGGPRIITVALQSLVRAIDLKQNPAEILAAPRVHHQWSPNQSVIDNSMPAEIVSKLTEMGHEIQKVRHVATAQAIQVLPGAITAASDPNVPSSARAI
ncbi:MAG: gamma-glutamyltransferase [Pirellulales bacterium]